MSIRLVGYDDVAQGYKRFIAAAGADPIFELPTGRTFKIQDESAVDLFVVGDDGSLTLGKSGLASTFAGSLVIAGDFTVQGSTFATEAETVLIADNHLYMNSGYTTVAAQTAGLVANYLPTATVDSTAGAGVFTAGVDATSDPTVTTAAASVFADTEFIQISGSVSNDGLYEVLSHAANLLTIRSTSNGVSNQAADFTQNQFTAGTDTGATITKVTVSVIRCGTDGVWETAAGATTGALSFADLATGATSGWTDDGGTIRLTTVTDEVAIGTTTASGKFTVRNDTGDGQNLITLEKFDGTDMFTVTGAGVATFVGNVNMSAGLDLTAVDMTLADDIAINFGSTDMSVEWQSATGFGQLLFPGTGTLGLIVAGNASLDPVNMATTGSGISVSIESNSATPAYANAVNGKVDNSAGTALTSGRMAAFIGQLEDNAGDSSGVAYVSFLAKTPVSNNALPNDLVALLIEPGYDASIFIETSGSIFFGSLAGPEGTVQYGSNTFTVKNSAALAGAELLTQIQATNTSGTASSDARLKLTTAVTNGTGVIEADSDQWDIAVGASQANAFNIGDGTQSWFDISTDTPAMSYGNATDNPAHTFLGTGQVTFNGNVDATSGLDVSGADLTLANVQLDINPTSVAETTPQIDITWAAGAYTGTLPGIVLDYSGITTWTQASGLFFGVDLVGQSITGGGLSVAQRIRGDWAAAMMIDADKSIFMNGTDTDVTGSIGYSSSNVMTVQVSTGAGIAGNSILDLNCNSNPSTGDALIRLSFGASKLEGSADNGSLTSTLSGALSLTTSGTASFGDTTGTWEFDGSGAVSETGMTSLSVTPSGAITLTAGAASTWRLATSSGSDTTLTIDSANAGAGAGIVNITGDQVNKNGDPIATGLSATSGEAIAVGELVCLDNSGGNPRVFKADADGGTELVNCVGYALTVTTGAAEAMQIGQTGETAVPDAEWDSVPVVGDVGKLVYLSTIAGNWTLTAPSTSGNTIQVVGVVSVGGTGAVKVAFALRNVPETVA